MRWPSVKRQQTDQSALFQLATSLVAGLVALLVPAALIAALGKAPLQTLLVLLDGAFGSSSAIEMTLLKTAPLFTAALGISVAYQAGLWNIGNLGQFVMGGLGAALVALAIGQVPGAWVAALLSGCLFGALWVLVPALLRALLSINEVVTTLLMNYIAILLLDLLLNGPLKNKVTGLPQTPRFAEFATLPLISGGSRVHLGVVLMVVVAALVYVLLFRSSLGYEIRAVGKNPAASRYGGVPVTRTVLIAMLTSGACSGLAGAGEVLGLHHKLLNGIASGYEYTPIVVALLGGLHPIGMGIASVFFGGLLVGARSMQVEAGLPTSFVLAIEALIVLFVIGARTAGRYRLQWREGRPPTRSAEGDESQQV